MSGIVSAARAIRWAVPFALAFAVGAGCAPDSDLDEDYEETDEGDEELRVCATGSTVEGIDVSYFQETIDWQKVADAGIDFAIVRVSYGSEFKDPKFNLNWAGARDAGLVRGLYQYYRPSQSPLDQAQLVLDSIANDPLTDRDLPIVLDIETTEGLSNTKVRQSMQIWLDAIEAGTGKRPIIYTAAFMQDVVGTGFSGYPLWAANYTTKCPLMPNGWSNWTMWQYSESGHVNGVPGNVDRNRFNGTREDLLAFAGADPASEPEPEQPDPEPPADVPGAPKNLTPVSGAHVTTDEVNMKCDAFSGASSYGFDVEWFNKSTNSWKAYYSYTTTSPNKTFWPVTDAAYRIRVRAKKSGVWSPYTNFNTFAFGNSTIP